MRLARSQLEQNLKDKELMSWISMVELIGFRGGNLGERSFMPEDISALFPD